MPGIVPLRVVPRFLTAHPDYLWLNRLQCLGVGQVNLESLEVGYDVCASETSPKTMQHPRGARIGRTAFHGEKARTMELAATPNSWHPSGLTLGSPEGEAWEGGRGVA